MAKQLDFPLTSQPDLHGESWTPTPYDETDAEAIFWSPEPWDENLPARGGFLRDFVFAARGMETPTSFACWSALYLISSCIRRDAWLKWFPKPMYANIFMVLVAPPRICGKTTIASFSAKILREFPSTIPDHTIRLLKTPRIVQNKATPEALIKALEPRVENIQQGTKINRVDQGSQVAIIVPELETFLGKQKYNEGLIGLLMDIFDCHDYWEYHSITHGVQQMRDMYVTFLGGTTPDGLDASVNDAAFGQGFMSRMVLVYESRSTRCFPMPQAVKGAPSNRELAARLGWIAANVRGEYHLSPDAFKIYEEWYREFRKTLEGGGEKSKLLYRVDNTLLKLSFLVRANRYEKGNEIGVDDFTEALRIVNATYHRAWEALDNVGATDYHKFLRLAEKRIKEKGKTDRRDILTNIRWPTSKDCTSAMNQLYQEGKIKISLEGKAMTYASTNGKEVYSWIGV